MDKDKKEAGISVSIKFPLDLYKQVKTEARKQERSFGAMVRVVLREKLVKTDF